jgi:hypothetical protein
MIHSNFLMEMMVVLKVNQGSKDAIRNTDEQSSLTLRVSRSVQWDIVDSRSTTCWGSIMRGKAKSGVVCGKLVYRTWLERI